MACQGITARLRFHLAVSPGPPFPFLSQLVLRARANGPTQGTGRVYAYLIWGWLKTAVPQALFCLLQVVNIEHVLRSIYLITHPANIYVVCTGLGVLEQRGQCLVLRRSSPGGAQETCHALEQQLTFLFSIPSPEGYHEFSSGKGFSQETMCLL